MANYNYGYQPQFTSNKLYVTSVEDALNRFASNNTIMSYFLQDESGVVEITTDMYGKKYPKVRPFVKEEQPKQPTDFITREEFDSLKAKIDSLTAKKKVTKDDTAE